MYLPVVCYGPVPVIRYRVRSTVRKVALLFVAGMPMFERLALRWSRAAAAAGSTVSPSDGAALHANPNFVNAVLIALIACIFLSVMLDSSLRRLFVGMPTSGLRMNDVWLRCAR